MHGQASQRARHLRTTRSLHPNEQADPRWPISMRKPDDHPCADHDVVLSVPPPREGLDTRPLRSRDAYPSRLRTWSHTPSIHEAPLLFP